MTSNDELTIAAGPVILRNFRENDLDDVHAIVGDDRVTQWLSFDSRDREAAHLMLQTMISSARIRPRNEYYMAVTEPLADRVIGFARLALGGAKAAKLGYALNADFQGRGFATLAARALTAHGFQTCDIHRITAAVGPDNEASVAVVKRLGFSYEGRLRDHVFTNGQWRDSLLFSLLATDLRR